MKPTTRISGYEPGPSERSSGRPFRYLLDGEEQHRFADQWEAEQYMDEDRERVQRMANEEGVAIVASLVDADETPGYEELRRDLVAPAPKPLRAARPAFIRQMHQERARLEVLSDKWLRILRRGGNQ